MRVYGYIRVSKTKGRKGKARFMSPEQQREAIEAWARSCDADVVEYIEDLDAKGWKHRPKLRRCVEAIESGTVDGMVVAKLDRFFRDQLGGHETLKRIKDAKGFIAIPGNGIDTRHQTGKMLFGFLLTIAEGDIDRTREIFSDARERAVARGIHPCPVPPAGYVRLEDEDGHVLGPLEPHPVIGPIITDVFARAARGEAWATIARMLEDNGVKTAYGNDAWQGRAVKATVRKRVYLGEARHGEFVNREAHPPLTDELTFRRAARVGRRNAASRTETPSLLAGLLRCAGCQYAMHAGLTGFKGAGRRYNCHRDHAAGRCAAPCAIHTSTGIEEWVSEQFLARLGDVRGAAQIDRSQLIELERAMNDALVARDAFRDDPRIIEAIGQDAFVAGLHERQRRYDEAADRLAQIKDDLERAGVLDPVEARRAWPALTVEERKRLLALGIDAIYLRAGRTRYSPLEGFVYICWRGEAPADLPHRGRQRNAGIIPFIFPESALGQDRGQLLGN